MVWPSELMPSTRPSSRGATKSQLGPSATGEPYPKQRAAHPPKFMLATVAPGQGWTARKQDDTTCPWRHLAASVSLKCCCIWSRVEPPLPSHRTRR